MLSDLRDQAGAQESKLEGEAEEGQAEGEVKEGEVEGGEPEKEAVREEGLDDEQ